MKVALKVTKLGRRTTVESHFIISKTGDGDMLDFVLIGIDDERKLVVSELENGCGCPEACYKQFDEDEVYSIYLTMAEMQRHEKDILLLGKLHVCSGQCYQHHPPCKQSKQEMPHASVLCIVMHMMLVPCGNLLSVSYII